MKTIIALLTTLLLVGCASDPWKDTIFGCASTPEAAVACRSLERQMNGVKQWTTKAPAATLVDGWTANGVKQYNTGDSIPVIMVANPCSDLNPLRKLDGCYSHARKRIELSNTLPASCIAETEQHEAMHAVGLSHDERMTSDCRRRVAVMGK